LTATRTHTEPAQAALSVKPGSPAGGGPIADLKEGNNKKMRTKVTKQFRLREGRTSLLLGGFLAIAALNAGAQAPSGANSGDVRFAVAHQHFGGGWCYGYLYVTAGQLRYEVVQPQSEHGHSFTADRSDVVAGHRSLFGQQEPAFQYFINIKVKRQSYNFLWLANEAEVKNGGAHRMTPPQAAPPDTVLAALQNPPPSDAASQAAAAPNSPPPAAPWTASANAGAGAQVQPAPAPDPVPEGDVRFAVAHQHRNSSWCYGYLYVTNDQVRYEVVQPGSDQKHGFAINRAGVTARGSAQDVFELVAPGATYRFRWLANEADVNSASARPANPPAAAPPDIVIKKIQSPTAGTSEVMSRPALENEVEASRPELWR